MTWYRALTKRAAKTPYGCWVGPQGQVKYCDTEEHGLVASDILLSLGRKPAIDFSKDPNGLGDTQTLLGMGWARLILQWPNIQLKVHPSTTQLSAICKEFINTAAKSIEVEMPGVSRGKYTIPQFREICNGKDPNALKPVNNNPWSNPEMFNSPAYARTVHPFVKRAATVETLPYFQELDEDGDYTPDVDHVSQVLKQKFNASIVRPIGQGDSGVAYMLSDGNVLKVTTNEMEGKMAQWLSRNPHPNIAKYFDVWKDGNLWYEVMEFVNTKLQDKATINALNQATDQKNCYEPSCALSILMDQKYRRMPHIGEITSVLKHLSRFPGRKPFDFLNPNNIGQQGNQLKFFDIT